METYNATVYSDAAVDPAFRTDRLPDTWALRIEMDYTDKSKVVLHYDTMPPEIERRELMWHLQSAAGRLRTFAVTVVEANGNRLDAPAIPPGTTR